MSIIDDGFESYSICCPWRNPRKRDKCCSATNHLSPVSFNTPDMDVCSSKNCAPWQFILHLIIDIQTGTIQHEKEEY